MSAESSPDKNAPVRVTLDDKVIKWNVADEFQHLSPHEFKELYVKVSDKAAIACLNLSGDTNIGVMIRTAAIMGIGHCYILGRRKYDRRSSVGTNHHIPLERIYVMQGKNSSEFDIPTMVTYFTELQKQYKLVFVEQVPNAYNYTEISIRKADGRLPPNTMFIFGNEATGLPAELHKFPNADYCAIKQYGIGRSLTVSVACGIILAEWRRNS
jgi:tRNA G18 (ribose-2'-O)-methylase SpoU